MPIESVLPARGASASPSLPLAFRPELPPGPLPASGGPSLAVPTRTTVKAFQRSARFFETCGVLRRRGRKCGLALNRIGSACALYAPSGPRPTGGKTQAAFFPLRWLYFPRSSRYLVFIPFQHIITAPERCQGAEGFLPGGERTYFRFPTGIFRRGVLIYYIDFTAPRGAAG